MNNYHIPHPSIRVPWHDAGWTGIVLQAPQLNGASAKLKRTIGHDKDDWEIAVAAMSTV